MEKNKIIAPVSDNDKAEFIGQIIDTFEDFLDEKEIIPYKEKNKWSTVKK